MNVVIAAAPGPTFPALDMVVTFLSHFVSQTNNSCHGISGAGYGSGRGGGRGRGHGGDRGGERGRRLVGVRGRTTVSNHNYTSSESENLPDDHKDKVREIEI